MALLFTLQISSFHEGYVNVFLMVNKIVHIVET